MAKILLVEDDRSLAIVIATCLETDKHIVETAHDAAGGLAAATMQEYDLFVLDWNLPDQPGLEICRTLRSRSNTSPVLMLTAKGSAVEKAQALDAGADDYVVKPFEPLELLARVRALLRRPKQVVSTVLTVGPITLNSDTLEVSYRGEIATLSAKEAAILQLLMRYPNQSFTAEALLQRLWGSSSESSLDTVRTHVKTLRKKLGDTDEAPLIKSIRNVGYRLAVD